jgi:hypothetical protein
MVRRSALILVAACLPALADFSYQETSKVTGGMMAGVMKFAGAFSKQAREPVVSTVAVQRNRMLHGSQHHASIVDLEKETITNIDFDRKQYSVMTFAQMKQMMEHMSQGMKSSPDAQKANVQFKVNVKDTGEKKNIAGYDTHEMILTLEMEGTDQQTGNKGGMVTTSDMWLAPKISGYDEIANFRKRMAEKLDWTPGSTGMVGNRSDVSKGMAELTKEGAKLNGMPVFQTVKMGFHAEGQQGGEQPAAQQQQQQEKPSLGSLLGGFGRKKKSQDEQSSEGGAPSQGSGDTAGSLMEMTTEMSGFSSAPVDASKFEIPAGFKQVEPEAQHRRR